MIDVTCTSIVGDFNFQFSSTDNVTRIKQRITGKTYIDESSFLLSFQGKPLREITKVGTLAPLLQEGAKITITFFKTDYARQQLNSYAKRHGFSVKESGLTLKQQLFLQEEDFKKDGVPGREYIPPPEDATDTKKGGRKFLKIFKKDTTSEKAIVKQRVKKRAKAIAQALENAYLATPELYTDCGLVYVDAKINGVQCKACIDSGAAKSVMLMQTAQKCGILNLVDPRFAGKVIGVGTSHMLGRVNHTKFEMGEFSGFFHISVMTSGSCEILLGLDFLRYYGVNVNVSEGQLEFRSGTIVPFLPFHKNPDVITPTPVLDSLVSAFGGNLNLSV